MVERRSWGTRVTGRLVPVWALRAPAGSGGGVCRGLRSWLTASGRRERAMTNNVTAASPAYPFSVGPTGRYLVDRRSDPFLMVGDAAWSIFVSLTKDEAVRYLDDRQHLASTPCWSTSSSTASRRPAAQPLRGGTVHDARRLRHSQSGLLRPRSVGHGARRRARIARAADRCLARVRPRRMARIPLPLRGLRQRDPPERPRRLPRLRALRRRALRRPRQHPVGDGRRSRPGRPSARD